VLQTNPVTTAGLYYISASANVGVDAADGLVTCFDLVAGGSQSQLAILLGSVQGTYVTLQGTLSITDALSLNSGDSVQVECWAGNSSGNSGVNNGGLTATLINSGSAGPGNVGHKRMSPSRLRQRK
jgi:hypothetical protein